MVFQTWVLDALNKLYMNFYFIIRNIHVISAAIWLGIVVVVNFGLEPPVARKMTQGEVNILKLIFKRVKNLISISAFSTFVTGDRKSVV